MTVENPYQPPKAEVIQTPPDESELAERGTRLGAVLVDGLIGLVVGVPIMFGLMFGLGIYDYIISQAKPLPFLVITAALSFVVFVLVHGYLLRKNGQTLGKRAFSIRISNLDGGVPPFSKLVGLRYLPIYLVTLIPVLGGILGLVDVLFIFRADRRCIHDLIAGTKVVKVRG